jgi:KDO2-lipid IV(A) lauroyltransferase
MSDISFRHRAEHAIVLVVARAAGALPHGVAVAIGGLIGRVFYRLDRRRRRLAVTNLEQAFPAWTHAECVAIGRRVFEHFGRLLIELLRFRRLTIEDMRRRVEFQGDERVHQAHRAGKGAIFITGHFGFWELHAIAHGAFLYPIAVVARPLDNPLLHVLLEGVRTATGNSVIYRRGGVRRILKALSSNQGVAVLIDQHIQPSDAIVVEFFGRPAATTAAVAALAARTGAPVIPVFALPIAHGRYRLIYEHPIEPPQDESHDALRAFTQRCTDVLEMYVRRYPELWLWMHRRWRVDEGAPRVAGTAPEDEEEKVLTGAADKE